MPRGPRIITLLTDFGLDDPFVGVLHGVIATIAPGARVIDLCHAVQPFAIAHGRFLLRQSWPYFPPGSIHVVVVDPGVGSERRALLVEAGGHVFIGPDNGVLTDAVAWAGAKVRAITNKSLRLKDVSNTFHGRDIFAPAAAHLAAGVAPARFGRLIHDALRGAEPGPVRTGRRIWQGTVEHADHFGNLITNFEAGEFLPLIEHGFRLRIGFETVTLCAAAYAAAPEGEPVVIAGSAGRLEVAVREDSAARRLGVGVGAPVELELQK